MGTICLPVLEEMLRRKDSKVRSVLLDIEAKQNLFSHPYLAHDYDQQRIAIKAVDVLGLQAKPMVPFLQGLVRNWPDHSLNVVAIASRIAKKFEPNTTPELVLIYGDLKPGDITLCSE